MVDFFGSAPSAGVERLIVDAGVGGVILFDKNITSPGQIAGLTNALQRRAAAAGRPPLLVGVDQEGGPVVRLRPTHFPSAMAFGGAGSDDLVDLAAAATGKELRAVGIHMNFSPVLDVNSNPANPVIGIRSYGEDPALVTRLGTRAVKALQSAGVLATAKHFPGHGDTALDSHLALPVVPHPRSRLEAVEWPPFRAAIGAGVAGIMTAHVVFPALDPDQPATLSPAVIGTLRSEFGFDGLVVSDSMRMHAITDRYSPGEAAVRAVLAGCDLLLACGPEEAQWEAIGAVQAAVAAGRIPQRRVDQASARLAAAKRRQGLFDCAVVSEDDVARRVGLPEHLALAERVAAAAATVVRDPADVLPFRPGSVTVVSGLVSQNVVDGLTEALRQCGLAVLPETLESDRAHRPPRPIVVPLGDRSAGDIAFRASLEEVARSALALGPAVAVATGSPYVLSEIPAGCTCVATYGADPASLRAAAGVLAGRIRPRGRLPVTIAPPP
jgi:beta-N-acetylhexosaminidase